MELLHYCNDPRGRYLPTRKYKIEIDVSMPGTSLGRLFGPKHLSTNKKLSAAEVAGRDPNRN